MCIPSRARQRSTHIGDQNSPLAHTRARTYETRLVFLSHSRSLVSRAQHRRTSALPLAGVVFVGYPPWALLRLSLSCSRTRGLRWLVDCSDISQRASAHLATTRHTLREMDAEPIDEGLSRRAIGCRGPRRLDEARTRYYAALGALRCSHCASRPPFAPSTLAVSLSLSLSLLVTVPTSRSRFLSLFI